jgi:hypothetical protein
MEQNKRTFSEIAQEVMNLWKAKYGKYSRNLPWSLQCAIPYLQAMLECDTTDKDAQYYAETVESVVVYFLANITSWRGDDAKRIKAELKSMLK